VLDPRLTLKTTRSQVHGIIARTLLRYPWPKYWQQLFPASDGRNSS